jgi:hypothetical protein
MISSFIQWTPCLIPLSWLLWIVCMIQGSTGIFLICWFHFLRIYTNK